MRRIILMRLVRVIPVLFIVSLGSFLMLELVPGDPAAVILGENATPERYDEVRSELGLDQPILERYSNWMTGVVTGDLGTSLIPPTQDVGDMLKARLPVTLELAVFAVFLSLLISIPLGVWSAYRLGSPVDTVINGGAFAALSIPSFLLGLLLIFVFIYNRGLAVGAVAALSITGAGTLLVKARRLIMRYGWAEGRKYVVGAALVLIVGIGVAALLPEFPRQGFVRLTSPEGLAGNLKSLFLPALTLALIEAAVFQRVLRADMAQTLEEDYVLASRAKGMGTYHVLFRDALRPSSLSLITVAGVTLGRLLGGTVIVESIFRLPGVGSMMVDSIRVNDFPVVQGTVLVLAVGFVVVNAAVDISYAMLDPRIRRA